MATFTCRAAPNIKKLFPGALDLSAAGHPTKGESYEQAIIREVHEELGIKVSVNELALIESFPPTDNFFYFRKYTCFEQM